MGTTKWAAAIVLALIVVLGLYFFVQQTDSSDLPVDATPIPDDVVLSPSTPLLSEVNLVFSADAVRPPNIVAMGGQTLRVQLVALDDGPSGNGYTFEIPAFELSKHVVRGTPVTFDFEPAYYGSFRFWVRGAGSDEGGMLIIREAE